MLALFAMTDTESARFFGVLPSEEPKTDIGYWILDIDEVKLSARFFGVLPREEPKVCNGIAASREYTLLAMTDTESARFFGVLPSS